MALSLPTGSDYLRRTTSLLNPAADSTYLLWVRETGLAPAPAYNTPFVLLDDPGVYVQWAGIFQNDASATLDISGGVPVVAAAPLEGVWVHYAWVQAGTAQRLYRNGVLIGTDTVNRAAFTVGFDLVGNDTFGPGGLDVAYVRQWQTALTVAEIIVEAASRTAVKTASLFLDTPLETNLLDVSGNGRNWTQIGAGSFSTASGPLTLVTGSRLYPLNFNPALFSAAMTSLFYPAGYRGDWNKVPAAGATTTVNTLCDIKYGSAAATTSTQTDTSATSPYRAACNKWITPPLKGAQTIQGTLDICVPLLESNADADFAIALHVWVSVGTTPEVRGTLIANYSEALSPRTEWPTGTLQFRSLLTPNVLDAVDAQDGDRIVVEIGFISYNAFSTSRTATIGRGAVTAAPPAGVTLPDAAAQLVAAGSLAAWVEFSQALTFVDTPVNDLCVNATDIGAPTLSSPYTEPSTNVERATWSSDDPDPSCSASARYTTRWWQYTATANGVLVFFNDTADVVLSAYTGVCGAFVEVQCQLNHYLSVTVAAGTTYFIKAAQRFPGGTSYGVEGYFMVPPTNDVCTAPIVIAGLPYSILTDSSVAATDSFVSGNFSIRRTKALFWEWTCPMGFTDNVEIDTAGSNYGSQICVTTGTCAVRAELTNAPWLLVPASEDEDGFIAQSKLVFRPTPGTTYTIRITTASDTGGGGRLNLSITAIPRLANDQVSGAMDISSANAVFVTQSNRPAADTQDTEPDPSCVNDNDPFVQGKYLWYRWTAPASVPTQFNTAISQDVRTGLVIYTGTPGALVEVACEWFNFATSSGRIIFTPAAGTPYYIRIWADSRTWTTMNLFISPIQTPPAGDVVVGCGAIWIFTPEGAVRDYLFLTGYVLSGLPTNGSFDPDLDTQLYVSQLGQDQIAHLDVTTQPMGLVAYLPTAPADAPEGNAFLSSGHLVTGFRGTAELRVYATPSGAIESVWPAEQDAEGTGWVDLARDLQTLYYTSAGRRIFRFDTLTGTQLSPFATLPAAGDAIAQGLRVLPDGGVILADYTRMVRISVGGVITHVYTFPDGEDVHVLDIDPTAATVWVGLTIGNWLYRIRLSDGAILLQLQVPTFPTGATALCGVAVKGGARTTEPPDTPGGGGGDACPPARFTLLPAPPGCATVGEL